MVYYAKDLVRLAEEELGYHEKASNSQLDDKYANSGSGNWTKYARDLALAGYYNGNKNGYAWCDVFVDWLFYKLANYNRSIGEWLICQTGDLGAACQYSANYYMQVGRYDRNPKVGDQIFFYADGCIGHTGIVSRVETDAVYSIEGNSSDQVSARHYSIYSDYIAGFGHPRYDMEPGDVDPIPDPGEEYPMLKYGDKGIWVRTLQTMLQDLGYSVGPSGADGEFGYYTKSAVLQLQNKYGLETDGIVGDATWDLIRKLHDGEDVKPDPTPGKLVPTILREEDIWASLSEMGFNDFACAGIIGNMYAESRLSSINLEDSWEGRIGYNDTSYTEAVDNGTYSRFADDYCGYGLCQWTFGSRKKGLLNYAQINKKSIGDGPMQLEYFLKELKSDFFSVYSTLLNATSVFEASTKMVTDFERPTGYNTEKVQAYRASLCQSYYDKYRSSGSITQNPDGLPTLSVGSTGTYVKDLQEKLIKLGYSCGTCGADGEFGNDTKVAVQRFQSDNEIYADGIVGANTWKVLNNMIENMNNSDSKRPELRYGSRGKDVEDLQTMLNALGFNCGEVDGDFGGMTSAAVQRFQSTNNLYCSGIVNDATWSVLEQKYKERKIT